MRVHVVPWLMLWTVRVKVLGFRGLSEGGQPVRGVWVGVRVSLGWFRLHRHGCPFLTPQRLRRVLWSNARPPWGQAGRATACGHHPASPHNGQTRERPGSGAGVTRREPVRCGRGGPWLPVEALSSGRRPPCGSVMASGAPGPCRADPEHCLPTGGFWSRSSGGKHCPSSLTTTSE